MIRVMWVIEHLGVFIGLWVGSIVRIDDVYIWEGVARDLEDVLAVEPHRKLTATWGMMKIQQ